MAWPTQGTAWAGTTQTLAIGVVASGTATTMRWGSAGVVTHTGATTNSAGTGTAVASFLVVTRISQRRKKEDLQYDNGDGVQSGRMQIFHGVEWDVTIREDTRMGIPTEGTYVTIYDIANHLGGTLTTPIAYAAYVLTCDVDTAPKQPGERVLKLERIKLIEG